MTIAASVSRCRRAGAAFCFLVIALWATPAPARDAAMVEALVGAWRGEGTLFGAEAGFHMEWEWVLDRKFLHLTFRNGFSRPEGLQRVLEAHAYYHPTGDGSYEGTWFDSRGVAQPLQASAEPGALTVLWGTAATEQGKTVYRLAAEGRIEVEDFVLKDGEWQRFGRAIYERASE